MVKFTNVENLKAWVNSVLKSDPYDFNAVLTELECDYGETARPEFEIGSRFTKSGHPELYRYEVKDTFYLDGVEVDPDESDLDDYDREYIF